MVCGAAEPLIGVVGCSTRDLQGELHDLARAEVELDGADGGVKTLGAYAPPTAGGTTGG